jgi:DNA-binding MarR family transcriptional regulator
MRKLETGKDAVTTEEGTSSAQAIMPGVDPIASHRRDIKLGYLLHDVSRMRRTAFDQLMKPLGITRAQWWVIAYLSRHDGMAQTELADKLDVGKASLGSLLDRLEATAFIERRPDPSDRRVKRIFLAPPALQVLEQLAEMEATFNREILKELSEDDRRELIRMLSSIKSSLTHLDAPSALPSS